jgi:DNA-binding transcriptional ArsR family regulator
MPRTRSLARIAAAAPVFAALGDAVRIRIVARLSHEGPLSVTSLTVDAGVTRQAVTKHLNVLVDAGVVRDARSGRERIFELDTKRLEIARACLETVSGQWDAALERLRAFVEED